MKIKTITRFFNSTKTLICLLLLFASSVYAQDPPQYGTPFAGVPDPRDVNMYQVHIRPFSANGNLAGVTARLDNIKALGTNVIYLMPIYPHGTDPKSSASPYCIKDFKAVASEYGSLADLRTLVDGAHNRGMAVILDVAINGTSWDNPWTIQHPEYYKRNGTTIQQLGNYSDIAALDLNNSGTRAAIKDAMRYWILAANIDGYRCDYANNPPLDFWSEVIGNIRGITSHKLLMLAEGDRQTNFTAGFDLNFGDRWFWTGLKDVAAGGPVSQRFQTINDYEYANATGTNQVVRFTGNHDTYTNENGIHRPFVVFNNHNGVVANFVVSAYMKGVPFLMSGQEIDYEPKTDWPWTGFKFNWSQNPTAAADFAKVLNFRTSSAAIRRGNLTMYANDDISVFTKTLNTEKVIVMSNLRNASKSYVIPAALAGTYVNPYNNASVTLTAGTTRSFGAYEYLVLTNSNVAVVAVTGVSVNPVTATIGLGSSQQLNAAIAPANATNKTVTWSSTNPAVATVNSSGLVTAVSAGTATITATSQNGNKTATAVITVNPGTNFTVYFYKPSTWGTGIKIYYWSALPAGVLADASWPGVNMNNNGNGWYSYTFTNITSTNLIFNDGTTQSADLNRNKTGWYMNSTWYDSNPGTGTAVTSVTLSPASASLSIGATQQLTPTVLPSNATNKNFTYSSNNTAVATVNSSGLITAVANGTAIITVTTVDGSKTSTCAVTVSTTPSGGTYYTIKNRWTGAYLSDAGANVGYGANASANNYKWQKIAVDATYFVLKNVATGELINIESQTGSVQCNLTDTGFWSAQWSSDNVDGTWIRIRNRWQSVNIVHVENQTGSAQYGNSQDGWFSAQWQLVPTTVGTAKSALKIEDVSTAEPVIGIYPNPATDNQFHVLMPELKNGDVAVITVSDLNGRAVLTHRLSTSGKVDHRLASGIYIVNIVSKDFKITKKLIIK